MDVLTVAGNGSTRGFTHGQDRAAQIVDGVAALRDHLAANGINVPAVVDRLMRSDLAATARTFTPDLWDEVVAIAAGANVGLEDILLLTFLDEVWSFTGGLGCSVVARRRDGFIGQTMDLPLWTAGRLMVLRVESESAPTALVMSYPGMIGLCGAGAGGLGVGVNALEQFQADGQGLAVAFITRHLLSLTTLTEAETFLTGVPHAAGQSYTVSAADGTATWECGPGQVVLATASGAPECAHTNHLLADPANSTRSSLHRLATLTQALAAGGDLRATLSRDVVLTDPKTSNAGVTFAAFAANLSDDHVDFADGRELRAGAPTWESINFLASENH